MAGHTVKIGGQDVTFDNPPTEQDLAEARQHLGLGAERPGVGGMLDKYLPGYASGRAELEQRAAQPVTDNLIDFGKHAAMEAPSIAASLIPGGGITGPLIRAAATGAGNAGVAYGTGAADPVVAGAVGAGGSLLGDIGLGVANKLQGSRQQTQDLQNVAGAFSRQTGQPVPATAQGMSRAFDAQEMPGSIPAEGRAAFTRNSEAIVRLSGNPPVDVLGERMPLDSALELVRDAGRQVNWAAARDAAGQKNAVFDRGQALGTIEDSLRNQGMPGVAAGIRQINAELRQVLGITRMVQGEGVLPPEGGLDMGALQAQMRLAMQKKNAGISRDPAVIDDLHSAIYRDPSNTSGYAQTDLPAQGLSALWGRVNPGHSAGASANLANLATMRLPQRIGNTVRVNPMAAGMLTPGIPLGVTGLLQDLQMMGMQGRY